MAFQRTGMDGATPEAAGSRRPESFHTGVSPRRAQREQEARNEALASGSLENQLYFSKKARRTDFDPKSLAEYRRLHPKEYVELGKLPADLNSPALIKKVGTRWCWLLGGWLVVWLVGWLVCFV